MDKLDTALINFRISRQLFYGITESNRSLIHRMYRKYFGRFSNHWDNQ
jgi:hypothetical protein